MRRDRTTARRLLERAFWKKPLELIRSEESHENLERTLGLFDLIMIGIGGTVGSGVFSTAGLIASSYAGPAAIISWIIAGIGCIFSGVSFMELSTIIPSSGSTYAYSYYAMGELAAMIAGFLLTLEYGVASAGGARSWSDKLTSLLSDFNITGPWWMKNEHVDLYAAGLLALCVSIVLSGISTGKLFINIITVTKISVVTFIIIVGLFHFNAENVSPFIPPSAVNENSEVIFGLPGIMLGASASFYGYIGYDEVCCLAGEALNPTKSIPKAVIGTVIGASVLSTFATLALVGAQHYSEIDSQASYGKAFENLGLTYCKTFVEVGEVLTMPVGVLIGFLAQPRLQFAMANDGLLPEIFGRIDSNGNLYYGTLLSGVMLTITSLTIKFSILWDFISLGILLAFNMTNTCLILSRTKKHRPTLSSRLTAAYVTISFLAAFVWQKGVIAHHLSSDDNSIVISGHVKLWNEVLAMFLTIVSVVLIFCIWYKCPQSFVKTVGDQGDCFKAPFVPLTPCVAIAFNWFLFVQMHWVPMFMILCWILLAMVSYVIATMSRSSETLSSHHTEGIGGDNPKQQQQQYEMVGTSGTTTTNIDDGDDDHTK